MSRTFSWACRIEMDREGRFHVIPFNRPDCEGIGSSVDEAKAAAANTMAVELDAADGLVLPPALLLDPEAIARGDVTRVEVELSD